MSALSIFRLSRIPLLGIKNNQTFSEYKYLIPNIE
jgi:hypothetical protein